MTTATPPRTTVDQLFERHRPTLEAAIGAIHDRGYWSAYPENPGEYPEEAAASGRAAFEAYRDRPFPLEQPGTTGWGGEERSPYGGDLGVTYPAPIPAPCLRRWRRRCPPGGTPASRRAPPSAWRHSAGSTHAATRWRTR